MAEWVGDGAACSDTAAPELEMDKGSGTAKRKGQRRDSRASPGALRCGGHRAALAGL